MGNTRNTGYLQNAIKVSDTGAISFMSGSTMLATINTSGQMSGSAPVLFASTASFVANAQTASFVALAQSASNAVAAQTASFANAFTVAGTLTAQTLVVQTITSSVDFVTGSTRFGSSLSTSTHQFTGSVSITGSLDVITNGTEFQVTSTGVKFGNVIGDAHNITGSVSISGSLSGTSATFSGNVGIGSNSPASKLSVGGDGYAGRAITAIANNADFAMTLRQDSATGSGLQIFVNQNLWGSGTTPFLIANLTGNLFSISSIGAATFSSSVTATTGTLSTTYNGGGIGMLHLTSNGTEGGTITFEKTSGTAQKYKFGLSTTSLFIYNETAGNQPFTLTSTGAATFLSSITTTKANTFNGSLSVANNTATFMQQCAADNGTGSIYLIVAAIGGAGSDRIAMGILVTISQGGGTARWAYQSDGANMFLTDPGSNGNIYVRHTAGGTSTVSYSILRIA